MIVVVLLFHVPSFFFMFLAPEHTKKTPGFFADFAVILVHSHASLHSVLKSFSMPQCLLCSHYLLLSQLPCSYIYCFNFHVNSRGLALQCSSWSCDYVVVSYDPQSSLEGVEETVSAITASVSQLFVITGHGLERCMQLTEGWGLPGLIRTLEVCEYLYSEWESQIDPLQ